MNILDAINDPNVFAPAFSRNKQSWEPWFAFLRVLFALPLTPEQLTLYQRCTGRTDPPSKPSTESWLICGRRAGKSFTLALIAVFLASFRDWRPYLNFGERGTIVIIGADRRQSRTIIRYVKGLLNAVPMLRQLIESERSDAVDLANRVTLEVHTASFRAVRGYTIIAALLDEVAFWAGEDSTSPDFEILNAVKPAMATIPGAMLLCASSPYARRGVLWDAYHKFFGQEGAGPLVWQAPTRVMNSTVPQNLIDEALEADPSAAAAEYLAEFRTDIEGYISREAIEAVTNMRALEHPPLRGKRYVGFCDPSGGSNDSMTLSIAHMGPDGIADLDVIRERRPPFSPESVVTEFADVLKQYRITKIKGDRYSGEWCRESFRRHGISYDPAPSPKSDLYRDLLPLINSGKVRLLNNKRMIAQLVGLERRTSRAGKDSIDHAPGGHDDVCNAVAGALIMATEKKPAMRQGVIDFARTGRITWHEEVERQRITVVRISEAEAIRLKECGEW